MKKTDKFIPVAQPDFTGNEKKYLNHALSSSWISSRGEFIDEFEKTFARFIGAGYAVSVSNGTAALHLALTALGIGPGDEVIVPDLTFIASANSVSYTGAVPVLSDVDKKSWNINTEKLEKLISGKTKAIMPVHLYGIPSDMNEITSIARRHKLMVIEDAAEAHGAEIKIGSVWKKVGSIGNAGCFSFYGNKIITTGEGGMVTTGDKNLAEKMKVLRDNGQDPHRRYFHPVIGFNYRMTNLAAAIGLAQLERINELLDIKNKINGFYREFLRDVPGIIFPETDYEVKTVCWLLSVIVDKPYPLSRDRLMGILEENEVESRPFFYPLSDMPPYKKNENYPASHYLSGHGINLPTGYNLTQKDIYRICSFIRNEIDFK